MIRTFVDSGVLIAGARGSGSSSRKAIEILDDSQRSFVSSSLVLLEVLPKALFHKQLAEAAFYRSYFESVKVWIDADRALSDEAFRLAARYGLAGVDALHLAAALAAGADEIVTSEKQGRPIHRVSTLPDTTIHL